MRSGRPWRRIRLLPLALPAGAILAIAQTNSPPSELPLDRPVGKLEVVATFDGPMPAGVSVSHAGRIFVNFPRWGDPVDFTVAELKDGRPVPYPTAALNALDLEHAAGSLVSVQSVVVDSNDRLWILDTGRVQWRPPVPGGPKLVGADLKTGLVFTTILIPPRVALPTSYLNDVRVDVRRGLSGVAFISDSAPDGPNGIIVVELASKRSWRRLNDHPSTKAEKDFLPIVEGRPLMNRPPNGLPSYMTVGADGIALQPDGKVLFYCPLSGSGLFSVWADALVDEKQTDAQVAETVISYGNRGFASDGLAYDAADRLYLTDYEDNAILRRNPNGLYETVVHDPRVLWPDTLAIGPDGYLYFTVNQLHRQAGFHGGQDQRLKPYVLFRVRIAPDGPATPAL
jgi:sugar lactone lactonase YvrE